MSRLTIDITDQQHQSLKALVALQGKTIKQYTLERLFPDDGDGDHAWQELRALLGTRIHEGVAGKVSAKRVEEVLDEELAKAIALDGLSADESSRSRSPGRSSATHATNGALRRCAATSPEIPHTAVPTSDRPAGFCACMSCRCSRREACVGRAANTRPARGIRPPAVCGFEPPDFPSARAAAATSWKEEAKMSRQRTHGPASPDDFPPEEAMAGPPGVGSGGAFSYGVHLEQLDALDRLLRMIAAHGDLLAIVQASELAPGTLPVIGQAIHDHAQAVRGILDQVEGQRPGQAPGRRGGVEEVRAGYAVGPRRLLSVQTLSRCRGRRLERHRAQRVWKSVWGQALTCGVPALWLTIAAPEHKVAICLLINTGEMRRGTSK